MAGNKNSGRKPKQKQIISNEASPTRIKSCRVKSRNKKLSLNASPSTDKKTQPRIDQYVKKLTPSSSTRGSPKKSKFPHEIPTAKALSPKRPKKGGGKENNKGDSRKFNCTYCNQAFSRKYDMEKHSRKV